MSIHQNKNSININSLSRPMADLGIPLVTSVPQFCLKTYLKKKKNKELPYWGQIHNPKQGDQPKVRDPSG